MKHCDTTIFFRPLANASFEVEVSRQTCRQLTSFITKPAQCI